MHQTLSFSRRYAVFLSYRHVDNRETGRQWATWLHHALETYDVPPDLVGKSNLRGEPVPASLFPVFRDEEELAADADLSLNIERALEASTLLVVLCSPRAVESSFVNEEIRYFKELGRADRILALILAGEPNARDPSLECLPAALRFGVARPTGGIDWNAPADPIAADARPTRTSEEGWTTAAAYQEMLEQGGTLTHRQIADLTKAYEHRLELAKLKIIAGALGLPLDELTRRNQVFQLAKARRRTRLLAGGLLVVTTLAIGAGAAGWIAVLNAREAKREAALASQQRELAVRQRDRALREAYLNIVRQASVLVSSGQRAAARKTLLRAPAGSREWEWWYLMSRCGPAPVTLDQFAALYPDRAARIRAALDRGGLPGGERPNGFFLRRESRGSSGGFWLAFRETEDGSILLNAFRTGLYGEAPPTILDGEDLIAWRIEENRDVQPPLLASGEVLRSGQDYVLALPERYVVGEIDESVTRFPNEFEPTTPSDAPTNGDLALAPDASTTDAIVVLNSIDDTAKRFEFASRTLSDHTPVDPLAERWAAADGITKSDLPFIGYTVAGGSGPYGPYVFSTWDPGNVRLRDAKSGAVIGASIVPPEEDLFPYRGSAAIVPGTEWVAGKMWWNGETFFGVVDLRAKQVISRFEDAPDVNPDWNWTLFAISPDGREAALRIDTKIESYFAVWDVESGKMVYGPQFLLPESFGWHPKGDFVAIHYSSGATELRRTFASAPFATIDGVASEVRIQQLDRNRILIGNAVVDATRWETVITIARDSCVLDDADRVVIEMQPGVIEVVRTGWRRKASTVRDTLLLAQIRESDLGTDAKE